MASNAKSQSAAGGYNFPPSAASSRNGNLSPNSLSGGVANSLEKVDRLNNGRLSGGDKATDVEALQSLTPARGRLGIEEIPFQGFDPIPNVVVPPPVGGWGEQAAREDYLKRFDNRSTQNLDGGGRSTNITRFTPQLQQWQQGDDLARHRQFERNQPSQVVRDRIVFV